MNPPLPKRGRRSGAESSRDTILTAARRLFAEQGYDATSLRQVAREAGVDAAMIHHFFAGKDALFSDCVQLPADPAVVLADVVTVPPAQRGEAMVRRLLDLWDSPARTALLALVRGALTSRTQAALLREVLNRRIVGVAVADLEGTASERSLRG
ncbi:MAG TPA: TetR family transcriptional regulator, partial [Micrococcaceae bacterium]